MREPPSSPGDGRKPGQSATSCGPGASRRPYRHPRSRGWRRQVAGASHSSGRRPHYDQAQTCLRGRTRMSPATSRILLGALVWKSASGEAHRRHRASRRIARGEERSGDGPAGPASLIEQSPTGVTTGVDCAARPDAAAARRRRVLVHQVQLERAGFRSDRASLPSKRSPAGVAVEVCPLRRCLFVVGLITIFKEGVCSSRCWSMRSQVPMRR